MGIETNVTSEGAAIEKLSMSDRVIQNSITQTGHQIEADWYTDDSKQIAGHVEITLVKGLVHSLNFRQMAPFAVNDLINVFGSPDEISIVAWQGQHGEEYASYALYYMVPELMMQIAIGSEHGPKAGDLVDWFRINDSIEFGTSRQPWLGFDREYLPSVPSSVP